MAKCSFPFHFEVTFPLSVLGRFLLFPGMRRWEMEGEVDILTPYHLHFFSLLSPIFFSLWLSMQHSISESREGSANFFCKRPEKKYFRF